MAAPMEFHVPNHFMENILAADDEDALLYHFWPTQTESTYESDMPRFDIEDFSDILCKKFFRFHKEDLYTLADHLRIPDEYQLSNRIKIDKMDALCMTLKRLSYPNRLMELERFFGWPKTTISMVVNYTVDHIYENFQGKINELDCRTDANVC